MADFDYDPSPSPVNEADLSRYTYDELQRIRDAFNVTARWDDLRFPAIALRLPGSGNPPQPEASTGLLLFSGTLDKTIAGVAQMPHSWKEGSKISPHVHYQKTTSAAGKVHWQLEYEVVNNGDVALMTYPNSIIETDPVAGTPDNDTANEILVTVFDATNDVDMTGKRISCLIFWRLSRLGSVDTYGADARMIELDFHYQIDSFGSAEIFTKR